MKIQLLTFLLFTIQALLPGALSTTPQSLTGKWQIEIKFQKLGNRSLIFIAQPGGQGSFQRNDVTSNLVDKADQSSANWSLDDHKTIRIEGAAEFPIGNVGRTGGILVLKGSFDNDGTISGDADLFANEEDAGNPKATPLRSGSFAAIRSGGV